MARPFRIGYPCAIHLITSRGNTWQSTFEGDEDREYFMELMESIVTRYNWLCHAYRLTDNHCHVSNLMELGTRNNCATQELTLSII